MAVDRVLRTANRLRNDGRGEEALALLRDALRVGGVPPEEMERAGRFVLRALAEKATTSPLQVLLLGQCTTSWLAPTLAAVAWGNDTPCVVREGTYDNVAQEIARLEVGASAASTLLILLPWHERLFAEGGRPPSARIEDELAFWRAIWQQAAEKRVARVIQVGYDWITAGANGYHLESQAEGRIGTVRRLNDALRRELPATAYFVPLDAVSGVMGRDRFYDLRRYHWTKQPFSDEGARTLAHHLSAALRAVTIGPRKVLVVDLDDTIWGGVVGELGPHGIALGETPDGEAYVAFQRHLKSLANRGVLLVACSKNNLPDAQEPFLTNHNMVLTLNDFAAFEANWDPKTESLKRIASSLRLSLDSFVFFDDNKAEQELVRQSLRDVAVVDVPDDPSEYVRALENGLWFEAVELTKEDGQRVARYAAESERSRSSAGTASIDEYLRSLEMVGDVRAVSEDDMARVVQLLSKTNQFNLTTRRHGNAQVRELLSRDGAFGLTLRLRDRFGDHGLVALAIGIPGGDDAIDGKALLIDTFLMSCRVIGRTAEQLLMRELLREARRRGYTHVTGEFSPTAKNALVKDFYVEMGFAGADEDGEISVGPNARYARRIDEGELPTSFVRDADRATRDALAGSNPEPRHTGAASLPHLRHED